MVYILVMNFVKMNLFFIGLDAGICGAECGLIHPEAAIYA
jgi:hypothetical protein